MHPCCCFTLPSAKQFHSSRGRRVLQALNELQFIMCNMFVTQCLKCLLYVFSDKYWCWAIAWLQILFSTIKEFWIELTNWCCKVRINKNKQSAFSALYEENDKLAQLSWSPRTCSYEPCWPVKPS